MTKLILIRHGQSVWNKENKFTGLTDVGLSNKGLEEAKNSSEIINNLDINIDVAFTSNLKRAINTCEIIIGDKKVDIIKDESLNERDYGFLTGKNKKEIIDEYGEYCIHKWRRGFYERPPNGENLYDVCERVSKYYYSTIFPYLKNKNVLISAHGNSLRALFVVLGLFSKEDIERVEIPTGRPYIINFEDSSVSDNHYMCPIKLNGRQILDSRGNPTLEVDVLLNNEIISRESAPSGASTGSNEARELRDKDDKYLGKGVQKSVLNVKKFNSSLYLDIEFIQNQIKFDKELCRYDGTTLKENLGGNTTTAISFAIASASAKINKKELFIHFKETFNTCKIYRLPTPMVNILNGGKHAGGKLKIQEFMIMPKDNISFKDKLHNVTLVYHNLGKILVERYGISSKNLGDEGGYAPQLDSPDDALNVIEEAILKSGFQPGEDIFLALDCASSEYYDKDKKKYEVEQGLYLTNTELVEYYNKLIERHPSMKSIEDPFDEYDYEGWKQFTEKMGNRIMIVGDDLFTTNIETVRKGISGKWANSLLLKVNQIGTITEAIESAKLIFDNNMDVIVSHRSGETTSTLISDLSVGIGAKYIKTGAPARGERVAKYNRLLQIEDYLDNNKDTFN
jgi:enolase